MGKPGGLELSDACVDDRLSGFCIINSFYLIRIVLVLNFLPFFSELSVDDPGESLHDHCVEQSPVQFGFEVCLFSQFIPDFPVDFSARK